MTCAACRADVRVDERVGRRDTCPQCGVDLHSCRQCRFHDRRAYNECREPQAERVVDKDRANFCDYFAPAQGAAPVSSPGTGTRQDLERLFRRR